MFLLTHGFQGNTLHDSRSSEERSCSTFRRGPAKPEGGMFNATPEPLVGPFPRVRVRWHHMKTEMRGSGPDKAREVGQGAETGGGGYVLEDESNPRCDAERHTRRPPPRGACDSRLDEESIRDTLRVFLSTLNSDITRRDYRI